jgi:hypothetical protein
VHATVRGQGRTEPRRETCRTRHRGFTCSTPPDHLREDCADIRRPLATDEENVILTRSSMGQGDHIVVTTHAADGVLLAVHIDASATDPIEG